MFKNATGPLLGSVRATTEARKNISSLVYFEKVMEAKSLKK